LAGDAPGETSGPGQVGDITLARKQKRLPQELGNLSLLGLARFYNGSVKQALAETAEAAKLDSFVG
jgi:hypothetical protein